MMKKIIFLFTLLLCTYGSILAQKSITVKSPDGNIRFTVQVNKNALPSYSVYYKNTQLVSNLITGHLETT